MVPVARLTELGYAIVIIPSDLQRAAMKAMAKGKRSDFDRYIRLIPDVPAVTGDN